MDIRQISAAERPDTLFPLGAYAFLPSPWPAAAREKARERSRFFESAVTLVAEEDGRALAGVAGLRMQQNVRGLVHEMAGVASVASDPTARRRGLVRELMGRLLRQMRDEGCSVSALYPFRPSFYARFGFVGIPRHRTASFPPEGLGHLLGAELPGAVEVLSMADGFEVFDAFGRELLTVRHGFAVFDEVRSAGFRDDDYWVAVARSGGAVVGVLRYRIDRYAGDLVGSHLLTTGAVGRALLLQFLGRHVDQVSRVVLELSTDEVPELWGTDFEVVTEGRVARPDRSGPMVRVLDMAALTGTSVGPGAVTVEITGDELIGGVWRLESAGGRLSVHRGSGPVAATLSAGGFSALLYGVLDPVEVGIRGLGAVPAEAVPVLTEMFPRQMPYLVADF